MAGLCDLALVLGLTLSGTCQPATPPAEPMPEDDPAAWSYRPAPPPPPPAPAPMPAMPPVVINKTIIQEVPVEPPKTVVEPPSPDPYAEAVEASYRQRSARLGTWPSIAVPASLPQFGLTPKTARPVVPAMPLDLAATITVPGSNAYEEKSITSTGPVDNSRVVTTDRIISGLAEDGVNTQLDGASGGSLVIQVDRDVFGYHGRSILIPKGSRLVCGYRSLEKVGSTRSQWRCGRLLAGGSRFEILGMKANVGDVQGHLGVSGEVDNRFWERYGTAFILAGVSAAVRVATAQAGTISTSSTASASGSTSTYSDGGALSQGGQEISQRFGEITAATLDRTINLNPFLRTFQGQRVTLRPDTDWYIVKVE